MIYSNPFSQRQGDFCVHDHFITAFYDDCPQAMLIQTIIQYVQPQPRDKESIKKCTGRTPFIQVQCKTLMVSYASRKRTQIDLTQRKPLQIGKEILQMSSIKSIYLQSKRTNKT